MWYNDIVNRNIAFHIVPVGYHRAVKRIAGLCTLNSNHLARQSVGVNIFRHIQFKRMFNIYLSIIKSQNKSMMCLKHYFSYNSFIRKNIAQMFFNDYNVFDNHRSTIMSRIDYE